MKKKLIKALCYVPEGQYVSLGDDTFLTGYLDGSDKIYGFGKLDGRLVVITRDGEYSIDNIGDDDLKFMFKFSNIFEKIKTYQYPIEYIN
jgi:hypothetical protein